MKRIIVFFLTFFLSYHLLSQEKFLIISIFPSKLEIYQILYEFTKQRIYSNNHKVEFKEYYLEEHNETKIIEEIKLLKPNLVYTIGTKAAKVVKDNIKDIPIVFNMVINTEEFISSNTTGIYINISADEKLRFIKKAFPKIKTIGVLYSKKSLAEFKSIFKSAKDLGFDINSREIISSQEFTSTIKEIFLKVDCFLMLIDSDLYFPQSVKFLLTESLKFKIPVIGISAGHTKAGCLLSFEVDCEDLGRQGGDIILKILNGESIQNIPISYPQKIRISLNLIVAKVLGIDIPVEIIEKAQEVIK